MLVFKPVFNQIAGKLFLKLTLSGFYRIWKNIRIRFAYHNNGNVWIDWIQKFIWSLVSLSHEIFGKKNFLGWDFPISK